MDRGIEIDTDMVATYSPAMIDQPPNASVRTWAFISEHEAKRILREYYFPESYYFPWSNPPEEGKPQLIRVERGVEFRIETYRLEDQPDARVDRVAGWCLGLGHRITLRKEAEAKLEAQLMVARSNPSTSQASIKRRQQLEDEAIALSAMNWIVL
jgi:hypothetical protein